ncbi:uncharacterized protein LOC133182601 [Saccostrea echinata]|uniref:uncharacterized protein LOC133182601 n=1 Tax=Saccostrea echinata TaxID=191078 RepID=UPI002A7FD792|nr:uncharacterized protein LOC133182601 [Saccostrea echinata]
MGFGKKSRSPQDKVGVGFEEEKNSRSSQDEALFFTFLSIFVKQSVPKPARQLEVWESPCGNANISFSSELFPIPTNPPLIDSTHMITSCVIVFREAKAALQDLKDIFKKDKLLSNEEALLITNANGSAVGLDFRVSPRSKNLVSDINSDYSLVSLAVLYIEDIKIRGKSTQIYTHVNPKILTLYRKLQGILCTFQNLMGINRADITTYISRSDFSLPTGDTADLIESDYLALVQICNLMTLLINKYS